MGMADIRGEKTFDFVADVIDPIINIAVDDEAAALFRIGKCPDGVEPRKHVAEHIRRTAPKLVRGHKRDLAAIMAALKGMDADEYMDGLTPSVLVADILELASDQEFIAFLS